MDIIFLIAVIFLIICYINRKKLAVKFGRKKAEIPDDLAILPEKKQLDVVEYKVLAYNAKDYVTTQDLENMMELRLEQALAGLAKQGVKYEVEFHSTGFVLVYLIKYWC